MPTAHHLLTPRTARWFSIGSASRDTRQVVYAFHGYGQLAERFARRFAGIASQVRLIVVPEGLSRFYVRGMGQGVEPQVGASWMTREDRDAEIEDQLRYLDALHRRVQDMVDGAPLQVTLLGFSQGTATLGRWLAHGTVQPALVILWAGRFPPELEPRLPSLLQQARVVVATGERDELIPAEDVRREVQRMRGAGVRFEHVTYDGGHDIDAGTLQRIFAEHGG